MQHDGNATLTADRLLSAQPTTVPEARPYWHRPDPLTSAVRLDPEHANLQRHFPTSWRHLLKVKALIDCTSSFDVPKAFPRAEMDVWIRRLLLEAADELDAFARAEQTAGNSETARDAALLTSNLREFVITGVWVDYRISAPAPDRPWIYCGPLTTWAQRDTRMPLTLLVTTPLSREQAVVDQVTEAIPSIVRSTERVLGRPVVATCEAPGMYTTELLLVGGESGQGHKNFAHFLPLETPNGLVPNSPFTVIFANVHRERLRRCSIPLLERHTGAAVEIPVDDVLAASIAWFRCHDLGHFWRAEDYMNNAELHSALGGFDLMAIEETYADCLGVVCAAQLWDETALSVAYYAELLRYLSRDPHSFADSVAARLECGWLAESGMPLDLASTKQLAETAASLTVLAGTAHDLLWSADSSRLEHVRDLLSEGNQTALRLDTLFTDIPTDITYSVG